MRHFHSRAIAAVTAAAIVLSAASVGVTPTYAASAQPHQKYRATDISTARKRVVHHRAARHRAVHHRHHNANAAAALGMFAAIAGGIIASSRRDRDYGYYDGGYYDDGYYGPGYSAPVYGGGWHRGGRVGHVAHIGGGHRGGGLAGALGGHPGGGHGGHHRH